MITKEINGEAFLFVRVPADAYYFEIYNTYQKEVRFLYKGSVNPLTCTEKIGEIGLRPHFKTLDKVEIIGVASSLSEEDWKGIVDIEFDTFLNYEEEKEIGSYYFTSATQSGLSLIASIKMQPQTTLILCKIHQ